MRTAFLSTALGLLIVLPGQPANAQGESILLSEAIRDATAVVALPDRVLMVTGPNGTFFCLVGVPASGMRQLSNGVAASSGYAATAFCAAMERVLSDQ